MAFDQLEPESFRFFPRQSGAVSGDLIFRIVDRQHSTDFWQHLLENLQTLCREVLHRIMNSGQSAAGRGEVIHQSEGHRVAADAEHDRCINRRCLRRRDH